MIATMQSFSGLLYEIAGKWGNKVKNSAASQRKKGWFLLLTKHVSIECSLKKKSDLKNPEIYILINRYM